MLEFEKKLMKVNKKRSLKKLKIHSRIIKLKQKFFSIIMFAAFGGVRDVYNQWKNLPIVHDINDRRVKVTKSFPSNLTSIFFIQRWKKFSSS